MKKLFEIKTGKGSILAKTFEILQNYLKEIQIKISTEGFFIGSYDISEESFTKIDLHKSKFEYFHCDKTIFLGVNTNNIYKAIKNINKRDTVVLFSEENSNKLTLTRQDPCGSITSYVIPILDLKNIIYKYIPEEKFTKYEHIINLPISIFKDTLKNLNLISACKIEIKSINKQLTFKTCNDDLNVDTQANFTFYELTDEQKRKINDLLSESFKSIKYTQYDDSIFNGKINLRKIKIFNKSANLCDTMNIYLSNDQAVVFEFFCADMGPYKYILKQIN
jgi:proliferating cell nuclear antigen PCNA